MNWLDYFLILVVGLSTLLAAMRGFVGEVISLVGWVVAFTVASRFSGQLEPYLSGIITSPTLLGVAAFAIAFIGTLVGMALIGALLKMVVGGAGLTALDRSLGMLFGFTRGALLIMVGFMILMTFEANPPSLVRQSVLSPHFVQGANLLGKALPEGSKILERIRSNFDQFQSKAGQIEKGLQQPMGRTLMDELQKTLSSEEKEAPKVAPLVERPPQPAPSQQDVKGMDDLFKKYNSNP
ncbi:MAG: CvpA family protein [Magnetococcales bacterium]|nr:CvpA family protein [Magnetococcales bacterium]NGZ27043.1 CvpA family protein [Magnetococcales bacterium]